MKNLRLIARDYFVESGFTVPTILSILEGKVTKKTLYNWRNNIDGSDPKGTWDEQRAEKIQLVSSIKENALLAAVSALQELVVTKNKTNYQNAQKALGILKVYQSLDFDKLIPVSEVEEDGKKLDPAKLVAEVEKLLMG